MRKIMLSMLAAGTVLATAAPALAADGCGRGYHRGWHNRCVPNRGDRVVVAPVGAPGVRLVIGNYYRGQGYWDGHRYWQNRYRWHGGWRYR
ncbi:MAG: hypothetical protein E7773_11110 [Sphingomonas sp.]|uniref:GCG_CRPN prefix-to-repeats domain-containing protein n=1 Tax=Sphingomonas sp. TaxID=28214 RepID=UPI0012283E21|nr:hypothetical protein [Sphingomonas sp.]THD35649.1 MAG: hypothetical protein E7773_11110 [Sphingomonas sp.]